MIAGAFSFLLHYEMWRRRFRTVYRNLEVRTWAVTFALASVVMLVGLARSGTYTSGEALFRKGIFTAISAHTSTGYTVTDSTLFVSDWGLIAPAGLLFALALGGMASSTAGGVKVIRIGLVAKGVFRDIRRAIQPDAAVVVSSYVQRTRQVLTDSRVRVAVTILVLYLSMFLAGTMVNIFYGHPFDQAFFEATSASVNGGISVGVLDPSNPVPMKIVFTLQMWLGRLEFMAAFALIGFVVSIFRGKG